MPGSFAVARRALRPLRPTLHAIKDYFRQTWRRYRCPALPSVDVRLVQEALATLDNARPQGDDATADEPIFLLGTGWRTGSTLLQRILTTDDRLLMWGEPLGRMALIPRITEALVAASRDWPVPGHAIDQLAGELSTSWIANLYPPTDQLRVALREFFWHWLAEPARARGYPRWGLKEVRLGAAEGCVLRWLFPQAKFLVMVRDPREAYRSISRAKDHWRVWYRWPDCPIHCAAAFARHWNRTALSWRDWPADYPCTVVRYEDLLCGQVDFRQLETTLGLTLNEQKALAAWPGRTPNRQELAAYERRMIEREARPGMKVYGYV